MHDRLTIDERIWAFKERADEIFGAKWHRGVVGDAIDIRHKETCPLVLTHGKDDYNAALREFNVSQGSIYLCHFGLLPYASYSREREKWEEEAAQLNAAFKRLVFALGMEREKNAFTPFIPFRPRGRKKKLNAGD
jgi:hypothetical protein